MKNKSRYIRLVSKQIRCQKKDKIQYLQILKNSLNEIPDDATLQEIIDISGNPDDLAAEFEQNFDVKKIKKYRAHQIICVLVAIIFFIVICSCVYSHSVYILGPSKVYTIDNSKEVTLFSPEELSSALQI